MSSIMEDMICQSAKDCQLIATLLGVKREMWDPCYHKEIHEEDRSCGSGMCNVIGGKVECMIVE